MIRLQMIRRAFPLFALAVALSAPVLAQDTQNPTSLGEFGDWSSYTYKTASGKVCYAVSSPKATDPKNAKRDPVFFLITHRVGQNVRNEVSTIIGYPFKKDTTVKVTVDNKDYELFTNGDGAWADTASKDKDIVTAMRRGQKLSVKGTSWRGTDTIDSYSLTGLKSALAKIDENCK
ncbi:invasion associated locus B family protein [soil metagenome]